MKLAQLFRKSRPARTQRVRSVADPMAHFSTRDWADLPTWHPATEADVRR